jgi:hypothetical protein
MFYHSYLSQLAGLVQLQQQGKRQSMLYSLVLQLQETLLL